MRVTDTLTGRPKASVSIPMRLVDWGLNLGTQFAPQVAQVHIEELNRVVHSGVEGKIIDVVDEEDGDHVEIYTD